MKCAVLEHLFFTENIFRIIFHFFLQLNISIFGDFYCILLHFNRIFNRNGASGSPKSLCCNFMSKIAPWDGSLRRARSRTGHQNLFKNVYEQHLWYEKKIFLAEASYEEIWRVEVMDFYENVQFLIRRRPQGAPKAKTAKWHFFLENRASGRQSPACQESNWTSKPFLKRI